jgi:hypothetical protein
MQILSQFVKPPSDTLLRYFNMFHPAPSPSSLQFIENASQADLLVVYRRLEDNLERAFYLLQILSELSQ